MGYSDQARVEAREISLGGDGASQYTDMSRRETVKTFHTSVEQWVRAAIEQGRDLWFWALTLQAAAVLPAVVPSCRAATGPAARR